MLVDTAKDSVITNDGATIIKQSAIDHPVAKVIMNVAKTQEEQCFDGTTTSLVFTGELMKQAKALLTNKIHPTKVLVSRSLHSKQKKSFWTWVLKPTRICLT